MAPVTFQKAFKCFNEVSEVSSMCPRILGAVGGSLEGVEYVL